MKRQGFDITSYVEVVSYFLISILLFVLVKEDLYLKYVTEKMAGYLYFASFLFFFWGCISISRIRHPHYQKNMQHCLLLFVLAILLVLPNQTLSVNDGVAAYIGAEAIHMLKEEQEEERAAGHYHSEVTNQELEGINTEKKQIFISDDQYGAWVTELFENCQAYDGYQIIMKGMLYQDETLKEKKEVAIVRLLMSCCTADMIPYGPTCYVKTESEEWLLFVQRNQWVMITGTLCCVRVGEEVEPRIRILKWRSVKAPETEYIY